MHVVCLGLFNLGGSFLLKLFSLPYTHILSVFLDYIKEISAPFMQCYVTELLVPIKAFKILQKVVFNPPLHAINFT